MAPGEESFVVATVDEQERVAFRRFPDCRSTWAETDA